MKRVSAIFIIIAIIMSFSACDTQPINPQENKIPTANSIPDGSSKPDNGTKSVSSADILRQGEIKRAIAYGYLNDGYDPQEVMTEKGMAALIRTFISVYSPDFMQVWDKLTVGANDEPIYRDYGALMLLKATELIGLTDFTSGPTPYFAYRHGLNTDAFYSDMRGNFRLFKDWEKTCTVISEQLLDNREVNYMNAAQEFAASRLSIVTGNMLFDFSFETSTMKLTEPLNREDAALAITRLYESVEEVAAVAKKEAEMPDLCTTVSQETIALANSMPEVSFDNLPKWHGYTVAMREWLFDPDSVSYTEDEIKAIAEMGFNYVRVPLRYESLFYTNSTDSIVYLSWEELDTLLSYCVKYGLHVSFELHDMPGFTTGGGDETDILFEDTTTQKLFADFWRCMATYFKDIPENLLSFILVTDPHSSDGSPLTDEQYSAVMKMAIKEIRAASPQRLIIASGVGVNWAKPCYGLVDEKVVQGTSAYILKDHTTTWPSYYMAKNHESKKGDIVINGDFSAGAKLSISVMQYTGANYSILSNGKAIAEFRVNGEIFDGKGLTVKSGNLDIEWCGQEGEIYGWYTVTVTLPSDSTELRLHETEGYYEVYNMKLENDEWSVSISADDNFVTSPEPPQITIGKDGTMTVVPEDAVCTIDTDGIDKRLSQYVKFTAETGVPFMILEFGFNQTISTEVAHAAADSFLSVLDKHSINWISWLDGFGPILNVADVEKRMAHGQEDYRRSGAEYTQLVGNYWVDPAYMEVYKRYMD